AVRLFRESCLSRFGLQKRRSLGETAGRAVKYTYSHKTPVMAAEINRHYSNGNLQNQLQRNYQVVVAATRDLGIGKDGKLPWKLPSDLKYFKEVTVSTLDPSKKNAVIMGRKTWESIPLQYRPLPGRLNIILTRSGSFDIATLQNVICCASLSSALELLSSTPYSLSIEKAIHLTDIETSFDCDTFIPSIDFSVFQPWYSSIPTVENNIRYSFVTYVRVRSSAPDKLHASNGCEPTENNSHKDQFEVEKFSFLPKVIFERHEEYMYLKLVQDIIENGATKNDRTGTGTLSKFGCQMRFNLRRSFPLLTTKRIFWRGVVEELLWFISGSTNAKFYVEKGELSCQMYQRSADMGLGVPFNIASYSLLTCIIAQVCGLSPGDFVHVIGDAHVYRTHVRPLEEQIQKQPKPFPILKINPLKNDIDSFVASDFKLIGYDPHHKIEMKMAVYSYYLMWWGLENKKLKMMLKGELSVSLSCCLPLVSH
ncbi:Bifunctional dihydrofolate reductase-thymidylate synthase, partial [Ananas comosus]